MLGLNVELVEGQPLTLGETYEMRRSFVVDERKRRAERRQRVEAGIAPREAQAGIQAQQGAGHNVAESIGEMPIIAAVADVGIDPAAGTTKPARPRRPVRDVVEQTVEVPDVAEPVIGNGTHVFDDVAGENSVK